MGPTGNLRIAGAGEAELRVWGGEAGEAELRVGGGGQVKLSYGYGWGR